MRLDNTTLRAQIVSMRGSQDPINDDAYYSQRLLLELNETIKSWVASSFKSKQVDYNITDAEERKITSIPRTCKTWRPSPLDALFQGRKITSSESKTVRDCVHDLIHPDKVDKVDQYLSPEDKTSISCDFQCQRRVSG